MAYEKQTFTPGQKLKAEHLNHIEQGVSEAAEVVDELTERLDEIGDTEAIVDAVMNALPTWEGGSY